ncbi:hypothetical protein ES703_41714 [subsurface metagenome]
MSVDLVALWICHHHLDLIACRGTVGAAAHPPDYSLEVDGLLRPVDGSFGVQIDLYCPVLILLIGIVVVLIQEREVIAVLDQHP